MFSSVYVPIGQVVRYFKGSKSILVSLGLEELSNKWSLRSTGNDLYYEMQSQVSGQMKVSVKLRSIGGVMEYRASSVNNKQNGAL